MCTNFVYTCVDVGGAMLGSMHTHEFGQLVFTKANNNKKQEV